VTLCVLSAAAHAQPTVCKFDAKPRSVVAGEKVVLSWEVQKAAEITIDPELGAVSRKDKRTVVPDRDTTYTLTARDAAGLQSRMTVTVSVTPAAGATSRPMGLGHVTGRHLLPTGTAEDPGFGLYSYLLFGESVSPSNRDRYLAILRQAIVGISSLADILANRPDLKQVNVLYIPVRSALTEEGQSEAALAGLILDIYDFARARLLLASLDAQYQKGPYFVSRLTPILQGKEVGRPYLFQDLSRADPALASVWVQSFLRQAAQRSPWNERSVARFALNFRNQIQVLADSISWNPKK
jgi:hypothetical protein